MERNPPSNNYLIYRNEPSVYRTIPSIVDSDIFFSLSGTHLIVPMVKILPTHLHPVTCLHHNAFHVVDVFFHGRNVLHDASVHCGWGKIFQFSG